MGTRKATAKELAGELTGDRRVEAEGRLDRRQHDPESPVTEVTDGQVDDEVERVRQRHGDV